MREVSFLCKSGSISILAIQLVELVAASREEQVLMGEVRACPTGCLRRGLTAASDAVGVGHLILDERLAKVAKP